MGHAQAAHVLTGFVAPLPGAAVCPGGLGQVVAVFDGTSHLVAVQEFRGSGR